MTALLDLNSLVRLMLLFACTVTYAKGLLPQQMQKSFFAKEETNMIKRVMYIGVVVGERMSPYISLFFMYYGVSRIVFLFY